MKKMQDGNVVEVTEDLHIYTFYLNYDPVFDCEESHATKIEIVADNQATAYGRVCALLGSNDNALSTIRLEDERPYT